MPLRAPPPCAGLLIAALAACGGDPADVAGDYTIAITSGDNGCALAGWTVGNTTSGIAVTITQDGASASATVQGTAAGVLVVLLGSATFTGDVDGDDLSMSIVGTVGRTQGSCAYTYDALLDGTLDGDFLEGTIEYRARTNAQPDCGALTGCVSSQAWNGTRPPS